MIDEVELSITVTVSGGARHALVEWLPSDPEAVELAISIACSQAATGYEFRGIRRCECGGQQLWLVQERPAKQDSLPAL